MSEWVPSHLDIGDAPSQPERDAAGLLGVYGATRIPLDLDIFLGILQSNGLSRVAGASLASDSEPRTLLPEPLASVLSLYVLLLVYVLLLDDSFILPKSSTTCLAHQPELSCYHGLGTEKGVRCQWPARDPPLPSTSGPPPSRVLRGWWRRSGVLRPSACSPT